ncbi:MAG TPA: c-type cytochrome, partial [Vicinamibacterales bacterium]|nr:c-type cytochrome [Vicinamibacterales bacterium]
MTHETERRARLAAFAVLAIVVTTFGASAQRRDYPIRPPGDPAAIERGKALYGVNCQFCHGADTRGGDSGPSLLRSGTVLDDQHGELIAPVVRGGRAGMPKFTLTDDQIADVAAFVHTFRAAGYDESRLKPPNIVVGDARAGETFFGRKCGSCHSASGDLRGIGTTITDPRLLQQTWLLPGSGAGRGGPPPVQVKPTTVTVTLPSGEKIDGRLDRIDDFVVALTLPDGSHRSFDTNGDTPKVEIHDPLQPHKDLLRTYSDTDIHNVTAYLVTLK